jgi:hypothetical protein
MLIILIWFILGQIFVDLSYRLFSSQFLSSQPGRFLLMHLNFLSMALGLAAVVRYVHSSSMTEFIREGENIRYGRILLGFASYLPFLVIGTLFSHVFSTARIAYAFNPTAFFSLLPVVLIFTPLQSTVEELVFRAYIGRGLRMNRMPVFGISIISGFLFLLLHLTNPEVSAYGSQPFLYIYYFLFGAAMMALGLSDGGFELPIGIHCANNLFTVLIVNYPSTAIPSAPIFLASHPAPLASTIVLTAGVVTIAALFIFSRHD